MDDAILRSTVDQAQKMLGSSEALRLTAQLRDTEVLDAIAMKPPGVGVEGDKARRETMEASRPSVERAFLLGWFTRELMTLEAMNKEKETNA